MTLRKLQILILITLTAASGQSAPLATPEPEEKYITVTNGFELHTIHRGTRVTLTAQDGSLLASGKFWGATVTSLSIRAGGAVTVVEAERIGEIKIRRSARIFQMARRFARAGAISGMIFGTTAAGLIMLEEREVVPIYLIFGPLFAFQWSVIGYIVGTVGAVGRYSDGLTLTIGYDDWQMVF